MIMLKYNMNKDIVEQKSMVGDVTKQYGKKLSNAFEGIFQNAGRKSDDSFKAFMMQDPKVKGGSRPVKDSKELQSATVNNLLDDLSLEKVNVGLFKTTNVPQGVLDGLAGDIVISDNFKTKYGQFTNDPVKLKAQLRKNGYSEQGADSIIQKVNPKLYNDAKIVKQQGKQIKSQDKTIQGLTAEIEELKKIVDDSKNITQSQVLDTISKAGKTKNITKNYYFTDTVNNAKKLKRAGAVKESEAAANAAKQVSSLSDMALKKFQLAKPMLKSKFWLYLGGLSGLAAGGWYLWNKLSNGDVNDPQKSIGPKCLTDLLNDNGTTVGHTKSGDPVIVNKKTGDPNYDNAGGLLFFTNNRVYMANNKQKGSWSCKGTSMAISENIKDTITRVLNEHYIKLNLLNEAAITPDEMAKDVNNVVDYLDFPVYGNDLKNTYNTLLKYKNSTVNGRPAGKQFLDLYTRSGLGGTGIDTSLSLVLTTDAADAQLKDSIHDLIISLSAGNVTPTNTSSNGGGINGIDIIWDGQQKPTQQTNQTSVNRPKLKIDYRPCSSFPFSFGCINPKIGEIQECIGVEPTKGYYGHKTYNHLININGYDLSGGITEEIYNEITNNCKALTPNNSNDFQNFDLPPEEKPTKKDTSITNDPVTNDPVTNPTADEIENNAPPVGEEYYYQLVTEKRLKGKVGDRRIKYKGEDLSVDELKLIDNYLKSNDYRLIKNKDKGHQYTGGEDDKYVWLKNRKSRKP